MITILILSSGELKAISQNRVWDKNISAPKNAGPKKYNFPPKTGSKTQKYCISVCFDVRYIFAISVILKSRNVFLKIYLHFQMGFKKKAQQCNLKIRFLSAAV